MIKQKTKLGSLYCTDSAKYLSGTNAEKLKGKVQLIITSPPFPLNKKKSYGNFSGQEYVDWFGSLAKTYSDLLTENGSIVVEIGNAWEQGRPVQSLLPLEALMSFLKNPSAALRLCQEFICYNPSRLPSPAEWVTVNRVRVTDSFTHVWWMSKTDFPKADNTKVLRPYSASMEKLLKSGKYNAGKRPSEHRISNKGFLKNNGGSISQNFFELEQIDPDREVRLPNIFSFSNTDSNSYFLKKCKEQGVQPHPARMPFGLAAFFIEFLTDPGDLILDPFAGSNTTGFMAELLERKWVSFECKEEYIEQSIIRFSDPILKKEVKNG